MHYKMKFFLSLVAIIVFAVFAMASFGFGSTNTSVEIKKCKPKPEVSGTLKVYLYLHEDDGTPAAGANVRLFLNHQVITDTMDCKTNYSEQVLNLTMGSDGRYLYNVQGYTHKNESDLWRAEVIYDKTAAYDTKRMTAVAIYDDDEIILNVTMIKPL